MEFENIISQIKKITSSTNDINNISNEDREKVVDLSYKLILDALNNDYFLIIGQLNLIEKIEQEFNLSELDSFFYLDIIAFAINKELPLEKQGKNITIPLCGVKKHDINEFIQSLKKTEINKNSYILILSDLFPKHKQFKVGYILIENLLENNKSNNELFNNFIKPLITAKPIHKDYIKKLNINFDSFSELGIIDSERLNLITDIIDLVNQIKTKKDDINNFYSELDYIVKLSFSSSKKTLYDMINNLKFFIKISDTKNTSLKIIKNKIDEINNKILDENKKISFLEFKKQFNNFKGISDPNYNLINKYLSYEFVGFKRICELKKLDYVKVDKFLNDKEIKRQSYKLQLCLDDNDKPFFKIIFGMNSLILEKYLINEDLGISFMNFVTNLEDEFKKFITVRDVYKNKIKKIINKIILNIEIGNDDIINLKCSGLFDNNKDIDKIVKEWKIHNIKVFDLEIEFNLKSEIMNIFISKYIPDLLNNEKLENKEIISKEVKLVDDNLLGLFLSSNNFLKNKIFDMFIKKMANVSDLHGKYVKVYKERKYIPLQQKLFKKKYKNCGYFFDDRCIYSIQKNWLMPIFKKDIKINLLFEKLYMSFIIEKNDINIIYKQIKDEVILLKEEIMNNEIKKQKEIIKNAQEKIREIQKI